MKKVEEVVNYDDSILLNFQDSLHQVDVRKWPKSSNLSFTIEFSTFHELVDVQFIVGNDEVLLRSIH